MAIEPKYLLALRAAKEASLLILKFYESKFDTLIKQDGSPVTEADLASSQLIKQILSDTNIPIIDEESEEIDFEIRKTWKQCWCVDPLDGTKEFIKGNGEFAVNIALIEHEKPIFGLIASPVKQQILIGSKDFGVFIIDFKELDNPSQWEKINPIKREGRYTIISSRSAIGSKTNNFIEQVQLRFGSSGTIHMGSSMKFFNLASNEASIYPRFAPTMEWDIAAGQAILEALGGKVIDTINYKSLCYNKEDLRNPHFIAVTKDFVDEFSHF